MYNEQNENQERVREEETEAPSNIEELNGAETHLTRKQKQAIQSRIRRKNKRNSSNQHN